MNRRRFLAAGGALALGGGALTARAFWPEQGFVNPCGWVLPGSAAGHAVIDQAWDGLDPAQVWDCHVHLAGLGDGGSGVWVNPRMDSPLNPWQYLQKLFYLNAGCVHDAPGRADQAYVERLHNLVDAMRPGFKLMLFAFDWFHDQRGARVPELTTFHCPDAYAARLAREHPRYFEWVASVHPYRADAIAALEWAAANGARAVKWLPPGMGMDPAAPRCDRYYEALARLKLPLITHGGEEQAVHAGELQALGNPLKLRRALDHGVRVVVAHCASLGEDRDLDRGANGPAVESIELFARLMADPRYERLLFGDISALPQINRMRYLKLVLERAEWHGRLLNGSDYPLPGVMPLFSVDRMVEAGLLEAAAAPVLKAVREANPLLFDFVLKRHLAWRGRRFPASVFETRPYFERRA